LLVTVNTRLKFEIEIVHDLSCHPIIAVLQTLETEDDIVSDFMAANLQQKFAVTSMCRIHLTSYTLTCIQHYDSRKVTNDHRHTDDIFKL